MDGGLFAALAPPLRFYSLMAGLTLLYLGLRAAARRAWGAEPWERRVRAIERFTLASLILAMLLFAVVQIVLRNFFRTGLIWIDPLLRHLVLWIGFAGAVVATGRLRHIHMDVIGRLLPPRPRIALLRATTLAAAVLCAILARAGWIFLGEERGFGGTGFLSIPNWVLLSVIFVGFALCAARFAARALAPSAELAAMSQEQEAAAPAGEGGHE